MESVIPESQSLCLVASTAEESGTEFAAASARVYKNPSALTASFPANSAGTSKSRKSEPSLAARVNLRWIGFFLGAAQLEPLEVE